jgi:hypothetical protein
MKNLIIHPKDETTTFLDPIYKQAQNKTVLQKDITEDKVSELINKSDRVMMMGHGCPSGLFSKGIFGRGYGKRWLAVCKDEVELLKDKSENIYIWCNADKFVEYYNLHGFYSGMFISEIGEARYCGVEATQEQVDESNNTFSEIVGKYINLPIKELYEKVMKEYRELAKTNPIAKYNHERLYYR